MADESNPPAILKPVFGIFAMLGWVLLMGLHVVWHYSFGWLFTTLADLLDRVSIPTGFFGRKHLFGTVSAWLRSLDRNVDHALVRAANGLEHSAVWLFSRAGAFFGWVASEIKTLALTVEHAIRKLITVTIPRLIHKALQLVWRELRGIIRYARKMVRWLVHELAAFKRAIWKAVRWELHQLGKFGRSLLHTIQGIARNFAKVWKRLKHAEHWLFGKGFTNLVRAAMGKLGAGFVFTYNWKNTGSWLTSWSIGDVVEFTKDAVQIAGTTDICKLAAYQFDVAVFIFEPVMQELIGVTNWFCFHSGDDLPSATKGTATYLEAWAPTATPPIEGPYVPTRLAPNSPLPRGVIEA